jgi:hypothetical protein
MTLVKSLNKLNITLETRLILIAEFVVLVAFFCLLHGDDKITVCLVIVD